MPTDPPYTTKRDKTERLALLTDALRDEPWVLSGAVDSWSDELEKSFDAIVFLFVPHDVRMERLRVRELEQLGSIDRDFMEWAAKYDTPGTDVRSLESQTAWLAARTCPILRIEGTPTPADSLSQARQFVG